MSRARATALALVNWKGVFFERYLLDRHVTALEGANGAGKTTVMIAAYVVLLPDMTRLRFSNVGESAASGDRGVWGRLGESARPSYSVMEFEFGDGQRVLAGVQLARKAEPSVELVPFLVSGADASLRISDILLITRDGHDEVPSLEELAAHLASRGARLEIFQTAKEYFSALFERGITPLRLSSDEERNKLNEMLRTSMTGGISRALTSELRSFLLREESGLSDTLRRMRENLEACRRTRIEVAEARTLEHEINSIYDAGQAMFAAAFGSVRARERELDVRAAQAAADVERAELTLASLEASFTEAKSREAQHVERRERAEVEHARARERAARAERARALCDKLAALREERAAREEAAAHARTERERTSLRRKELKHQRDALREGYERAARGLSDSERGLDELHRIAADQRRARRLLTEARELLGDATLEPNDCEQAAQRARAELDRLDQERARADRARELALLRERDRAAALEALRSIDPSAPRETAYEAAREALTRLQRLESEAGRRDELAVSRDEALALAARQRAARSRAGELGLPPDATSRAISDELSAAQSRLQSAEREAQEQRELAEAARAELERCRTTRAELERDCLVFDDVQERKARLARATGGDLGTREGLARVYSSVLGEREQLRQRFRELNEERDRVARTRSALESGGGSVDPNLVALCEELEGELLANRFEELDLSQAALMEAELGPLARAIVVDDLERATEDVLKSGRELDVVVLVQEGADPRARVAPPRIEGRRAIIRESYGLRIAELPQRPSLGFAARKRHVEDLAERSRKIEQELESTEQGLKQSEGTLRECEELSARAAALELADPRPRLADLAQQQKRLASEAEAHAERAQGALSEAGRARLLRDGLVGLLPESFLFDAPDHDARGAELTQALDRANRARAELERAGKARETLARLLDALADAATPVAGEAESQRALEEQRERIFKAAETLREFERVRHTLEFEDAERALAERTSVLPALEAQHRDAERALANAEATLTEADSEWEAVALTVAETEAARAAVEAHEQRVNAELAELELDAEAGEAAQRALRSVEHWTNELAALARDEREFAAERAVSAERHAQARERVAELKRAEADARAELGPARETYEALREAAERVRLPLLRALEPALASRASAQLAAEAASKLELLWGRLSTARGASDLIEKLQGEVDASAERGDSIYLSVWLAVREWLGRRVPAQIADVSDPLLGLERLRDQLSVLEHRLQRQEHDLRGASEDVARGIDVGLRRAKAQVRRLNQSLEGVAFGSIQSVRVQLKRVERMDQVLNALRSGAAQELLFQSNLPIEEALNEIFKRFAGGKTGGQRLLDYREYLELSVEIRRHTGSDWETANPARLSTGEAIGVGATLMMVILTEWERDANLLRGKRAGGTLRFLFLDEANRLSQDNLGVLFELCKHLDLQLLIAAPEVARADGNTTYRLVRRLTDDGREEVLVSGRRVQTPASEAKEEAAPTPGTAPGPAQLTLLDGPPN